MRTCMSYARYDYKILHFRYRVLHCYITAMQILNAYRGGMAMWIDLSSPVQQSSVANSDTFVVSSGTNEDTFVIEGRTKAPEKRNTSDSLKENNHELIKVTNSSVTWTNVFRKIFCTSER